MQASKEPRNQNRKKKNTNQPTPENRERMAIPRTTTHPPTQRLMIHHRRRSPLAILVIPFIRLDLHPSAIHRSGERTDERKARGSKRAQAQAQAERKGKGRRGGAFWFVRVKG